MDGSVTIDKRLFIGCILMCGCTELIEYSPYDTPVKTLDFNRTESVKIPPEGIPPGDTFKIAVFSDTHEFYDNMADAINSINKRSDVQFIACLGDITNFGLANEFEGYLEEARKSKFPILTAIGNHDHRSNGYQIFDKLFGSPNFSVVSGNYEFIFFDDVLVENDYVSLHYEWLIDELSDSSHYNIVLAHLPPFTPEMRGFHNLLYCEIVNPVNTILCLYGHVSEYFELEYNGIHTLVSTKINLREYYIVSLINDQAVIEPVKF
jgi:Icc-related predicted phosphoesterase